MGAAEGKVQEKGYVASFPSLINVAGQPTYIMVLKDQNGLVMLYALVNVETHNIVATGVSQQAAKEAYMELLLDRDVISEDEKPVVETQSADITVTDVRLATLNGNTVVYITAEDGIVYKGMLSDDESLILVTAGQKLTVEYETTAHDKIRLINTWKLFEESVPEETESDA